jgi:hypothetical protein
MKLASISVRDLLERARLVDAQVVDQDVELGEAVQRRLRAVRRGEVGRQRFQPRVGVGRADAADRLVDARLAAAVDDHAGALPGQRLRDGEADPGGRAGDQGQLAVQLQVHAVLHPLGNAR